MRALIFNIPMEEDTNDTEVIRALETQYFWRGYFTRAFARNWNNSHQHQHSQRFRNERVMERFNARTFTGKIPFVGLKRNNAETSFAGKIRS